jgi:hypothetical protein
MLAHVACLPNMHRLNMHKIDELNSKRSQSSSLDILRFKFYCRFVHFSPHFLYKKLLPTHLLTMPDFFGGVTFGEIGLLVLLRLS